VRSLESALEIQCDFNRAQVLKALVDFQQGHVDDALDSVTKLLAIQEEPLLLALLGLPARAQG
jgi:hypothetical protein